MTVPFTVLIISGLLWLGLMAARVNSGGHWIYDWLVDVCRILFAVSALVRLWPSMTERVF